MGSRLSVLLPRVRLPLGGRGNAARFVAEHPAAVAPAVAPVLAARPAPRTRTVHAVFSSRDKRGIVTDVDLYATDSSDGGERVIEISRYKPTCGRHGCPRLLFHSFSQVPLATGDLRVAGELRAVAVRKQGRIGRDLTRGTDELQLDRTWRPDGHTLVDHHEADERARSAVVKGEPRAGGVNLTPKRSVDAEIEEW